MVAKACALRCQWSFPVFRNNSAGPTSCATSLKSPPQGRLLRGRSRRHLSRQQQKPGAAGFPPLATSLATPPSQRRGLRGTRSRALIELFQRARIALEKSPHHQRHRTRLPRSAPTHPSHVQLLQYRKLRPHHLRRHLAPEQFLGKNTLLRIYTNYLTVSMSTVT